jgi:hypothetical protein
MRHFILLLTLLVTSIGYSQSYLGMVTKQVNFRTGPDVAFEIISSLKAGSQLFIISLETENDFYNVIDIASDKEGYIHKSYVRIGKMVPLNDGGMFTPSGKKESYNPELKIYNNTTLSLTLKLNNQTYYFSPKETKTITVSPGSCFYRASAPGVIPNIGNESLESNMDYSWEFYVVTSRR